MDDIKFKATISVEKKHIPINSTPEEYIVNCLKTGKNLNIQLNADTEEHKWLKQLQSKLIENRANETAQASPIYYGILDFKEVPCPDGYGATYQVYNIASGCSMDIEQFAKTYKSDIIRYQNDNDIVYQNRKRRI